MSIPEKNKIISDSIERASVRIVARRFHKSKTTAMRIIHERSRALPNNVDAAKKLNPKWSGVLVIDGKRFRAYDSGSAGIWKSLSIKERKRLHWFTWIVGVDAGTSDIPHESVAEEETKIDIITYFKELKNCNYPLTAVVSDGVPWYGQCAKKIFGDQIVVQHCARHFLERCRTKMEQWEGAKGNLRTRMLIFLIKRIIESGNLEQAELWLERLKRNKHILVRTRTQRWIVKRFKREAKYLTAYLHHPELKIPRTTNLAENMIGQVEKRLSTIGRFNRWQYGKDYLHAWSLWRRFTPLTDCKGERKNRNGKSPLQLAGVDTEKLDWLNL